MSFDYEHTVTTTATPADVWALWSDVGSWRRWDPTVEQVAIEGHFAEGAAGTMVLTKGGRRSSSSRSSSPVLATSTS